MKKLLFGLMITAITSGTFAGIIENKKTGETLELTLDRQERTVDIISSSTNVPNKRINLVELRVDSSDIDLLAGTHWIGSLDGHYAAGLFFPPITPVGVSIVLYDVLAMPVKGTIKAITNAKMKKDFQILNKAIQSTGTETVGEKRFRRIEKLLK